jgi:Zn-finger nucleic acid-binding protein
VAARARTGYLIPLDQCARCGGLWCDRWELFPLAAEEVARLDPADPARLHAPHADPRGPGRCPRCARPLQRFRDPFVPPDADIERCRACDGMWLNRGALRRVKQRAASSPAARGALATELAQRYAATAPPPTVTRLDDAMQHARPEPQPGDLRAAAWSAAAWAVLHFLFRLWLGR